MHGEGDASRRSVLLSSAAAATSLVAGCLGGGGSGIESTFDEGKDGWEAVDLAASDGSSDPDWTEVIQPLEITHVGEGGVEGSGYVERRDTTGKAFFFDAPAAFLGDLSDFAGGRLEFWMRSTASDYRLDSAVVLEGPDGVVATRFAPPGTGWTEYSIELDGGARTYNASNLQGGPVDPSRVEAALADLRALRISGEHGSRIEEVVGLDEVRLVPP